MSRPWAVATLSLAAFSFCAATTAPASAAEPPHFVEQAQAAGLVHVYDGGWEFFVVGGGAVFDCDGDVREDLYLAGGSRPEALFRNASVPGGILHFVPLASPETALTAVIGSYPLDIDGDGHVDLAVLRVGENVLLRELWQCRFARANEAWTFHGGSAWTTGFSARWEGANGWPTLAFGNYVDRDKPGAPFGTCHDDELVRPANGGGAFAPPVTLAPGYCTLSILFSEWDRSGVADLRIRNDRQYYRGGEEQLWRVRAGEPPELYGRDDGWARLQIWGMGIASYDLTGDGLLEYFLTSMGDNKLMTLEAGPEQPLYQSIARERGATAHRPFAVGEGLPSTDWHADLQDVNNDGFIDLFIAKGNIEAMPVFARRDPSSLLLGEPDGRFTEEAPAAGLVSYARARGAALADFNLDGMLDLAVVNRKDNVRVWRNLGWGSPERPAPMGNWRALRLRVAFSCLPGGSAIIARDATAVAA